jgi:hypothetical protein
MCSQHRVGSYSTLSVSWSGICWAGRGTYPDTTAITDALVATFPFDAEALATAVTERLGQPVQIIPRWLPVDSARKWTGPVDEDVIVYNADRPELAVAPTGHAVGHLLLGHCGQVRESCQFASIASTAMRSRKDAGEQRRLLMPAIMSSLPLRMPCSSWS